MNGEQHSNEHDDDNQNDNDDTTVAITAAAATTSILHVPPPPPPPIPPKSGSKNSELSLSEKNAKKQLKAHLKQRMKLKKYETRYNQAKTRNDIPVMEQAQKEYQDLYQRLWNDSDSILHTIELKQNPKPAQLGTGNTDNGGGNSDANNNDENQNQQQQDLVEVEIMARKQQPGRDWILQNIWNPLRSTIFAESDRKKETTEARELLQNMTHGTQTKVMFDNNQALLGYTRHKFVERAVLTMMSLDRYFELEPYKHQLVEGGSGINSMPTTIWSIGCGPGCDAAGVLCYYQQHSKPIHKLLLTDYVMPEWNQMVVNDLIPHLTKYIPVVETAVCDVCHSLIGESVNQDVASYIMNDDDDINSGRHRYLVVISYLITETRGKWHDFFRDAFQILPPGTLILLSEPVAWQVHQFLDMFQEYIDHHQWLDSSRDFPNLQGLERRMGAAVVMICIKQKQ